MAFMRAKVNMLVALYFKIINDSLTKLVVSLNYIIHMHLLSIDKRTTYKLHRFNSTLNQE